ncbi:hypothetical protein V1525DRAFT_407750 [Lipomyces kononenkoae]|uniref:Uncharacterized protein n=1 Tax=Lipomyces kononenkoae TaxID=34357 RepID=A0ACC3SXT8_LIPKO
MDEYPCIICLQGLPTIDPLEAPNHSDSQKGDADDAQQKNLVTAKVLEDAVAPDDFDGTNSIARLVPCGHQLHDKCIQMWIEQATSCPTCRTNFNSVEILHTVNGDAVSSYNVETKVQVADLDESLLDLDQFEDEQDLCTCLVCDLGNREDELLLCDSCDAPYHASCLGMDGVPVEAWYCPSCVDNHLVTESTMRVAHARSRVSTARVQRRTTRSRRRQTRMWDRAWQAVWDRLNNDLDNTSDEDGNSQYESTRRDDSVRQRDADEWRVWRMRLRVAEATGGSSFFRSTASLFLNPPRQPEETPEMVDSWSMLEQALEIEEGARSTSASGDHSRQRSTHGSADGQSKRPNPIPAELELGSESRRKLKRPKAHRCQSVSNIAVSESVTKSVSEGPSLMKSLLQDIRRPSSPSTDLHSHGLKVPLPTPISMSPPLVASPAPSHNTFLRSPSGSPVLMPSPRSLPSPAGDPKSPIMSSMSPVCPQPLSPNSTASSSPQKFQLSLEEKTEIQEIVRDALRPHYRAGDLSKDQYTDINKKVSHLLYDLAIREINSNDSSSVMENIKDRLVEIATTEVRLELERIRGSAY